jgi:hypothetical protein
MPNNTGPKLIHATDEWLSEEEFADLIGRTRRTLRKWRERGIGPPFAAAGRSKLYRRSSWPEYLKSIEVKPARNSRTLPRHMSARAR